MVGSIRALAKAITKLDRKTKIEIVFIIFVLTTARALNDIMTQVLEIVALFIIIELIIYYLCREWKNSLEQLLFWAIILISLFAVVLYYNNLEKISAYILTGTILTAPFILVKHLALDCY